MGDKLILKTVAFFCVVSFCFIEVGFSQEIITAKKYNLGTKLLPEKVKPSATKLSYHQNIAPYIIGSSGSNKAAFLQATYQKVDSLRRKNSAIYFKDPLKTDAPEPYALKMTAIENLLADYYPSFTERFHTILVEEDKDKSFYLHQDKKDFAFVHIDNPKEGKNHIVISKQLFGALQIETLTWLLEEAASHTFRLDSAKPRPRQTFHPELHGLLFRKIEQELDWHRWSNTPEKIQQHQAQLLEEGRRLLTERRFPFPEPSIFIVSPEENERRAKQEWSKLIEQLRENGLLAERIDTFQKKLNLNTLFLSKKVRFMLSIFKKAPKEARRYGRYLREKWASLLRWQNKSSKLVFRKAEKLDVVRNQITRELITTPEAFIKRSKGLYQVDMGGNHNIPLYIAHDHVYLFPVIKFLGLQEGLAIINKDFHDDIGPTPVPRKTSLRNLQDVWDYTENEMHEGGVFTLLTKETNLRELYWIPTSVFLQMSHFDELSESYRVTDKGEKLGFSKGPRGAGAGVPISTKKVKAYRLNPESSRSKHKQETVRYTLLPPRSFGLVNWPDNSHDFVLSIDLDALNSIPAYRFQEEIDAFIEELKTLPFHFKGIFITPSKDYMIFNESQQYAEELLNYTVTRLYEEGILDNTRLLPQEHHGISIKTFFSLTLKSA